jgi:hypothetical protein
MKEIEVIGNILFSNVKPNILRKSEYQRWNRVGSPMTVVQNLYRRKDHKVMEVKYNATYLIEISAPRLDFDLDQPIFFEVAPDDFLMGYVEKLSAGGSYHGSTMNGHTELTVLVNELEGN